jgi:hypothetical protein
MTPAVNDLALELVRSTRSPSHTLMADAARREMSGAAGQAAGAHDQRMGGEEALLRFL